MELNKGTALLLLKKAVVWLTFRRLFVTFATALALITSYTLYENRSSVLEQYNTGDMSTMVPREQPFELSQRNMQRVDDVIARSARIVGGMVYITNIKVNQKRLLYYRFDVPALTQIWSETQKMHSDVSMVFDPTDQANNVQMVAVVNGEFMCTKFQETEYTRTAPDMVKSVQSVCRISIPAFYGNFSGMITFFVSTPVDPVTETEVRLEAVRLSNEVYRELVLNRGSGS